MVRERLSFVPVRMAVLCCHGMHAGLQPCSVGCGAYFLATNAPATSQKKMRMDQGIFHAHIKEQTVNL